MGGARGGWAGPLRVGTVTRRKKLWLFVVDASLDPLLGARPWMQLDGEKDTPGFLNILL